MRSEERRSQSMVRMARRWCEDGGVKSKRNSDIPFTMKPLISSLERLTSHETKIPPGMILLSQDPPMRRHLIRMESDDNEGSKSEDSRGELTMREIGIIFPKTTGKQQAKRRKSGWEKEESLGCRGSINHLFSHRAHSQQEFPSQTRGFRYHRSRHQSERMYDR